MLSVAPGVHLLLVRFRYHSKISTMRYLWQNPWENLWFVAELMDPTTSCVSSSPTSSAPPPPRPHLRCYLLHENSGGSLIEPTLKMNYEKEQYIPTAKVCCCLNTLMLSGIIGLHTGTSLVVINTRLVGEKKNTGTTFKVSSNNTILHGWNLRQDIFCTNFRQKEEKKRSGRGRMSL